MSARQQPMPRAAKHAGPARQAGHQPRLGPRQRQAHCDCTPAHPAAGGGMRPLLRRQRPARSMRPGCPATGCTSGAVAARGSRRMRPRGSMRTRHSVCSGGGPTTCPESRCSLLAAGVSLRRGAVGRSSVQCQPNQSVAHPVMMHHHMLKSLSCCCLAPPASLPALPVPSRGEPPKFGAHSLALFLPSAKPWITPALLHPSCSAAPKPSG